MSSAHATKLRPWKFDNHATAVLGNPETAVQRLKSAASLALNQTAARVLSLSGTATTRMTAMDENRVAGTARNLGGKVQEGAGHLAGDVKTELEGKLNQAAGSAQEMYGQARDAARQGLEAAQDKAEDAAAAVREQASGLEQTIRTSMNERPLMTVAVALGVGWLVGRMMHH
jgi:uncharacterized protein YjbJ (UPF0337 family)